MQVMSSWLGKKAEGVGQQLLPGLQVQPAPVLIESVKDGLEDSLYERDYVTPFGSPPAPTLLARADFED
jgi:hypothetical protein